MIAWTDEQRDAWNDFVAEIAARQAANEAASWYRKPLPSVFHRCRAVQSGYLYGSLRERCACGAYRADGFWWTGRNSRRRWRLLRDPRHAKAPATPVGHDGGSGTAG